MKKLLKALIDDQKGEGDINKHPTDDIVHCLKKEWIKMYPSNRNYKNIRITRSGRKQVPE